jgi:hypothetical protein
MTRLLARVEEVEPGVWEAGLTKEDSKSVSVTCEQLTARFVTREEAEAWVRQQAGGEMVWREDDGAGAT